MSINLWTPQRVMVFCWLLATGVATGADSASAPAPRALSFNTCMEKVLGENPALQASARRREAAQQRAHQAGVIPNPRLEAAVENFSGTGDYAGSSEAESSLVLSQEVELGGERRARLMAAAAEVAGVQAGHEALTLDLIRDTRRAFVAVRLAQEKRRLAEEGMRLAEAIEKTTAMRVTAGKTTPLESDRVHLETARAGLVHDDALVECAAARQALAGLWGASDVTFDTVEGALEEDQVDPPPLEGLLANLPRTPEIARAEADLLSAQSRMRAEKASRLPNFEISAGVSKFEDTGDSALMAGVGMELPIFSRNAGGIRAAAADLEAARVEAAAVPPALMLELRRQHARLRNQAKRIATLRGIGLPATDRALAVAQNGYREGKFGYLEVLDAQRVFLELRLEYAEALAALHDGLADLDRLTGSVPHPFETN